jgi:hypothetical protein
MTMAAAGESLSGFHVSALLLSGGLGLVCPVGSGVAAVGVKSCARNATAITPRSSLNPPQTRPGSNKKKAN